MHSPEEFGDSLVGVRATVEAVNERLAPIIAFEEGRIYNGEEFIAVLADTPYAAALRAAEKLRATVAAAAISAKREITISVGVTEAAPDDSQESVVSRADEAMYRAKRSGKNRVEGSAEGAQPGPGQKLH